MPSQSYSPFAKIMHWLIAFLALAVFIFAFFMSNLPVGPKKFAYYDYHKWVGITILALTVLRLGGRLWKGVPPPMNTLQNWEQRAAKLGHTLLYVLTLAVPLMGWMMSSAKGRPVIYLQRWQIMDLVTPDPELAVRLASAHVFCAYTLLALISLHIAAALKHYWIDRDQTLQRMLPFLTAKPRV